MRCGKTQIIKYDIRFQHIVQSHRNWGERNGKEKTNFNIS